MAGWREAAAAIGPELRLLGLVSGASRAGGAAKALDLIEVSRIPRRIQRRRRWCAELIAGGQRKRHHLGPLHVLGHAIQRCRGTPFSDGCAAVVGDEVQVAIGGPNVDHRARNAVTQRDTCGLGSTVGNLG